MSWPIAFSERTDIMYLVITILKTKNNYRLRMKKPTPLAPNEFCYAFKVTINKKEWFDRIAEIDLGRASPPEPPKVDSIQLIMPKATATIVLDRLAGRESKPEVIRKVEPKNDNP